MTSVVISQPMYFPWVGFLGQMAMADSFIWLDDAQFSKGSFTNRVQVKTQGGHAWLTVPLAGKGAFQKIYDLSSADPDWRSSHRSMLARELGGSAHLDDALELFDSGTAHERLVDALIGSGEAIADYMGVLPGSTMRTSSMSVGGSSSERVLELVKSVGGTRYITGHGAANYLDHELFERAGVEVHYMAYDVPPWPQAHEGFTPFVTALDLIASRGPDARLHLPRRTLDWRTFLADRSN